MGTVKVGVGGAERWSVVGCRTGWDWLGLVGTGWDWLGGGMREVDGARERMKLGRDRCGPLGGG